jgi:hypothetical protein
MALRDVFNGMMNGPRGQRRPSTGMALLGLLAYKAFKGDSTQAPNPEPKDPNPPPRRWL